MKINFGKYKNKTLEVVEVEDVDYLKWLYLKAKSNELSDKKLQEYLLNNYRINEAYLWIGESLSPLLYLHVWTELWDGEGSTDRIMYGLYRRENC